MTARLPPGPSLSRRTFLALSAGLGAAALPLPGLAADPLLTRPIPHGGERLPCVGIGTAIVFDIGADAAKRAERTEVIRAMVAGGARLIDTAPSYGSAEDVVGDLLAANGLRDRIFLATKVRVAGRDETLAEMRRSLERLKTSKVDLMQVHNVRDPNTDLGVLREWREQGRTRYIGITNSNPASYDALAEVVRREKPDFLQVSYSMSERQAEARLLPVAADAGTAVLTALPFGRGRLFSAVRGKPLPGLAAEIGAASWAQFFLKYLLSNPAVNCVIPGTDKAEYMTDNMNAARGRMPDAGQRRRMVELWESLA
jgi:aryl-alcohol dehydrogenase-like predicted oxidoreductase